MSLFTKKIKHVSSFKHAAVIITVYPVLNPNIYSATFYIYQFVGTKSGV